MRTICAWCGVVLTDGPETPVSHGICAGCVEKVREEDDASPDVPPPDEDPLFHGQYDTWSEWRGER